MPILEYGNIFFSAASVENCKLLQIMQNRRLHCALNRGIDTSNAELHKEAHLLKLVFKKRTAHSQFPTERAIH